MESQNQMSAGKKKHDTRLIRVGLFCIASIVVFYFGANFLKGIDVFKKKTYYYAVFDDLDGLTVGSPVVLHGFKIGKITGISIFDTRPVKLCTEIFVTENMSIPVDSKVVVSSGDLLGGKLLTLEMGQSLVFLHGGDTLVAGEATGEMTDMMDNVGNLVLKLDSVVSGINKVFYADGGLDNFSHALARLDTTMYNVQGIMKDNRPQINKLVNDITLFAHSLHEITPDLKHAISNIEQITDTVAQFELGKVLNDMQYSMNSLSSLLHKMEHGDGNVGKLLNEDKLYTNLETTTAELNMLLKDLRENPKRYVHFSLFGKREKVEKH
ncbi:MAG: MlaD family protein [Bacteroidales bacterium]|jgi:phospholipid/cholesterol/gamma-HCH transport system substrate-binding protein|nr:MlaD family protein [Bacteroidales bacterium]